MEFDGTNQDWYNICTALRGPDSDDIFARVIKLSTTARFRHITGIGGDGWCIVQYDRVEPSRDVNYVIESSKLTRKPIWWHHWYCHTFKGAESIGKLYPEYMMEMDMIANMLRYIDHIFKRKELFKGQIWDVKITNH